MASVHYSILSAVKTAIEGLNLQMLAGGTLPTAQVYLRKIPTDREITLPAVLVCPWGQEVFQDSVNAADDTGYPVLVTTVWTTKQTETDGKDHSMDVRDLYLQWRESIRNLFRNKKLAAVSTVYVCRVDPQPILDMSLWQQQGLDVGSLLLRFYSREVRS